MQKSYGGLAAALLCVVLFITGCDDRQAVYTSGLTAESYEPDGAEVAVDAEADAVGNITESLDREIEQSASEQEKMYVYVCGAVRAPGVYPIAGGMRVFEAIELAGGFTEEADTQWLNQAEPVHDGQKLYIYTLEETQEMTAEGSVGAVWENDGSANARMEDGSVLSDGRVNINTASKSLLMTLPGIGEAKADAVIQYRTEQGAFSSVEEIQNVPGIKNAVFLKIKDLITVGT